MILERDLSVIKTGKKESNQLIVSLPSDWVRFMGIKRWDILKAICTDKFMIVLSDAKEAKRIVSEYGFKKEE